MVPSHTELRERCGSSLRYMVVSGQSLYVQFYYYDYYKDGWYEGMDGKPHLFNNLPLYFSFYTR